MRAQAHIFVADKAPWLEITGPLPQVPAMPPGWQTRAPSRASLKSS